ncbi:MAG: endonuclease MutS2, partial [Bacteroidales bacterium]|nr:endonuclease MutS2 [Bacteroidales bacterium]
GGLVVDESATGKTAYVQPAEIVAINTRLKELRSEERREIIRILKDVSSNIRPYAPDMIHSIEALGEIDFVRGKALYAKEIDATLPIIDEEPGFYLSGARHPLLMKQLEEQGKKIVPLNIELASPSSRMLIISGPNAGGKSVCLQTVGLLQLMLQSGLLVPVNEGSRMCVFQNLFIDIGDNQSIENDLSTYSSHLLAMKQFVRNADGATLILIDEFGTGTEPLVGGAIAQAVLAELNRLGAFGVLTTHYTNLKHFATQTDGLVNGAMTFDTQKIEPKFSLLIGQPGSSFAFEIAHKIGLPDKILQEARETMGQENADYDRNLRQINRDKHYWEQKRQ